MVKISGGLIMGVSLLVAPPTAAMTDGRGIRAGIAGDRSAAPAELPRVMRQDGKPPVAVGDRDRRPAFPIAAAAIKRPDRFAGPGSDGADAGFRGAGLHIGGSAMVAPGARRSSSIGPSHAVLPAHVADASLPPPSAAPVAAGPRPEGDWPEAMMWGLMLAGAGWFGSVSRLRKLSMSHL